MNCRFKTLKRIWNPGVGLSLHRGIIQVYNHNNLNFFFYKTAWPIKVNFYRKHLCEGRICVIINKLGHMTKMAAMHIRVYGKKPLKNLLRRKC